MKKNKDIIEIEAITINIGDTSVKVTPQQARVLFDALADLLGEPKQRITWWPYQPYTYTLNGTTNSTLPALTSSTYHTSGGDPKIIDIQ